METRGLSLHRGGGWQYPTASAMVCRNKPTALGISLWGGEKQGKKQRKLMDFEKSLEHAQGCIKMKMVKMAQFFCFFF